MLTDITEKIVSTSLSQDGSILFFSLLGGVLPALIWLFFWLREDKKRPEPRGLIMLTFVSGMLAVPLVIPFQKLTLNTQNIWVTFLIWAAIEEIFKFGAAYFGALRKKENNEPVDALIYMMTAALGFAAMENAIFIFDPLSNGNVTESLITGNTRFIGASLLHTISSAAVGIAWALSFYKDSKTRSFDIFWGLVIAIALHTGFNLFIMKEQTGTTLAAFGFIWIAIVILMLFFEKIKSIYPVNKIE